MSQLESSPPPERGRRPSRKKLILIPLIAIVLIIVLGIGACWYAGRQALNQALAILNFKPELAEVRVGSLWALPLLNRVYAREVTITVKKIPGGPVELRAGRIKARPRPAGPGGGRAWEVEFTDLELERQSGRAALSQLTSTAEVLKGQKTLQLSQGDLRSFSLTREGRVGAAAAFDRLTFQQLALGLPADWTASHRPLDWRLKIEAGALENLKLAGRLRGLTKELPALNAALSGHNAESDWSLSLKLRRAEALAGAEDEPEAPASGWGGLMNRAKDQAADLRKMLEIRSLSLEARGGWAEAGPAAEPVRAALSTELPGLFDMTLIGRDQAPGREEVYRWAATCRRPNDESNPGDQRCLRVLGFEELEAEYADQGLMRKKSLVRPMYNRLLTGPGEGPLTGRLALPALGAGLGLWLDQNDYQPGAAGTFTFSREDGRMYPFRLDFTRDLGDTVKVEFSLQKP